MLRTPRPRLAARRSPSGVAPLAAAPRRHDHAGHVRRARAHLRAYRRRLDHQRPDRDAKEAAAKATVEKSSHEARQSSSTIARSRGDGPARHRASQDVGPDTQPADGVDVAILPESTDVPADELRPALDAPTGRHAVPHERGAAAGLLGPAAARISTSAHGQEALPRLRPAARAELGRAPALLLLPARRGRRPGRPGHQHHHRYRHRAGARCSVWSSTSSPAWW